MKKFIKWFIIIFVVFFALLGAAIVIVFSMLDTEPSVRSNSYVEMTLGGFIHEYRAPEALEEFIERYPMDMNKIRQVLKMASIDRRVKGVILDIRSLQIGFAKLQELRKLITDFHMSGKKILALLDFAMTREYLLATACDSVYLVPGGILLLPGISAEVTFYKGLLNKAGIEADFVSIGKYKNAPDVYMRQTMSDAQKEVIDDILDSRFHEIISTIAINRGLTEEKVIQLVNNISGFSPEDAQKNNLIDGIKYREELNNIMNGNEDDLHKIDASDYSRISPSSVGMEKGPKVAVIYCSGLITDGEDGGDFLTGNLMGAQRVIRNIEDAVESNSIKAIILRVNSGGGSGIASDKIWHSIIKAKEEKPVIASISDVGASGGYYISMAADTILAQRGSLIGSIGVFAGKFSLDNLYNKLDLNAVILKRGENAGIFSIHSKFSQSERKIIRAMVEDFYISFVQKVAESRNMTFDAIDQISRGRVWQGENGFTNGLIDYLGGLDDAIEIAKKMSGIDPDRDVRLVCYPKKRSFITKILKYISVDEQNLIYQFKKIESNINMFQSKPLTLMPFILEIK